jgi:hypothetical protein
MAIAKSDKFRGQQVNVVVKVPVGKQIRFDRSIERKLNPVNYRFTHKNRWNRFDEDWDVDVYTDFDYTADVDYIMTADGLRRTDGKDNEKYKYKNSDAQDELQEIERRKEELKEREQEIKKEIDTNRYRYQPGKPAADTARTKAIASLNENNVLLFQPITVSAL